MNHLLKDNKRAQGMVEFALTAPLLLSILFAIVEFGRMMFIYSAVTTASREASRYGAAVGDGPNGTPRFAECQAIRDTAIRIGGLVGVEYGDVYINYDNGPDDPLYDTPDATFSNCPNVTAVSSGSRMIVSVRGVFNPIPAIPLVNVPVYEFESVSRRTIVKGEIIVNDTTAVGEIASLTPTSTATLDPSITPSITPTLTPSITPGGPTATETPTPTATYTSSPTPEPPTAPEFEEILWTPSGVKCNDVVLIWEPPEEWATYPATDPIEYQTYKNGVPTDILTPNDPDPTVWNTTDQFNNNVFTEYKIYALFSGGLLSDPLIKLYTCKNGVMRDSTDNIVVTWTVPTDGAEINGISSTAFSATAWDTDVGTDNGDGIDRIEYELLDPNGVLILEHSEYIVEFCVFGGNGPCDTWDDSADILWANADFGIYTLRARGVNTLFVAGEWVEITFDLKSK